MDLYSTFRFFNEISNALVALVQTKEDCLKKLFKIVRNEMRPRSHQSRSKISQLTYTISERVEHKLLSRTFTQFLLALNLHIFIALSLLLNPQSTRFLSAVTPKI